MTIVINWYNGSKKESKESHKRQERQEEVSLAYLFIF
jgi:hypothetical protein